MILKLPKYETDEDAQDGKELQSCVHEHPPGEDDTQDPE